MQKRLIPRPIFSDFLFQELHTTLQLIHTIHTIFDTDPSVKSYALQFGENGIVVVQPPADLAVAQA